MRIVGKEEETAANRHHIGRGKGGSWELGIGSGNSKSDGGGWIGGSC